MLSLATSMPAAPNASAAGATGASPATASPTAASPAAETTAPIASFHSLLLPAAVPTAEGALPSGSDPASPTVIADEALPVDAEDPVDERSTQEAAVSLLLQWLRPAPAASPAPPSSRPSASATPIAASTVSPQAIAPLLNALTTSAPAAVAADAATVATTPVSPSPPPASADRPMPADAVFEHQLELRPLPATVASDTAPLQELASPMASNPGVSATEAPASLAPPSVATAPLVEAGVRAPVPSAPASPPPQTLQMTEADWPLALGEQIAWSLDHQQPEATIELHPAELGSLVVRIETRGADAQVTIVAATAAARDLLQQSLPQLRELLMVQGLNLSRAQIDRPSAAGQGQQQDQPSFRERGPGGGSRRRVGRLLLVDAYA